MRFILPFTLAVLMMFSITSRKGVPPAAPRAVTSDEAPPRCQAPCEEFICPC